MKSEFDGKALENLGDCLLLREALQPDRLAFTFLGARGEPAEPTKEWTYRELHHRAQGVAAALREACPARSRALLVYDAGPEFIAAFFGCLYADVVAVPVESGSGKGRQRARLAAIARDADCAVVLTSKAGLAPLSGMADVLGGLPCLATDELRSDSLDRPNFGANDRHQVAYLQYTSGSTCEPRGVMVTHGNALYNLDYIDRDFLHDADSVSVTWLPHFHDMGLVYGLLQPVRSGFRCVVLAPAAFVQRPLTWLEAISRFRGTHSASPNFGYDLCVQKAGSEPLDHLDLTSWRIAVNGAEPVRARTMARFADTFGKCGFRGSAFYPAYGLAEATLKVSGGCWSADRVDPSEGRLLGQVVSCGVAAHDTEVAIVDPDKRAVCGPGEVGEVWVHGPGVAQGYWARSEETETTFGARVAGEDSRRYLRTGDLGFLRDGEVHITGRLKELLIIRGQNHYPQDVELTARDAHPACLGRPGAAFVADDSDAQGVVLVQEIDRHAHDLEGIAQAIREAVAREHGLQAQSVLLVGPAVVPRTSSGKIQRRLCRTRFVEGGLTALHASGLRRQASEAETTHERSERTARELIGRCLRASVPSCPREQTLAALGLDSLGAMNLTHLLEAEHGVELNGMQVLNGLTVGALAEIIATSRRAPSGVSAGGSIGDDPRPLSRDQERLWLMDQVSPGSPAYNVAVAYRLKGALDLGRLGRAAGEVQEQHEALRARFLVIDGQPKQLFDAAACELETVSLKELPPTVREEQALRLLNDLAHRSFDLARGCLFRIDVVQLDIEDHIVLLSAHHAVADLWSMRLAAKEILSRYAGLPAAAPVGIAGRGRGYSAYVAAEERQLQDGSLAPQIAWWKQHLQDVPTGLALPYDRAVPETASHAGGQVSARIDAQRWAKLRAFALGLDSTPFAVLLAAWYAVLARLTGQKDIVVGAPVANRRRAADAGVIGFFARPLPLRIRLNDDDPCFEQIVGQVKQVLREGLQCQEVPFATIVEAAAPRRASTQVPLIRAMLGYLPEVHEVQLPGVELTPVTLESRATDVELFLQIDERPGGLEVNLRFAAQRFRSETAADICRSFQRVLEQVTDDPQRTLSGLTLSGKLAQANRSVRIAVASTFVDEPLREVLTFWSRETAIPLEATFAPYNQVIQQLVTPGATLNRTGDALKVLAIRLQDWEGPALEQNVQDLVASIRGAVTRGCGPMLIVICPSPPTADPVMRALEDRMAADLGGTPGVRVIRGDDIAARYHVAQLHDATADRVAHVPYTSELYTALGTAMFRQAIACVRAPLKVIVCDCDETLWQGVCGEDGPERLTLTPARRRLQQLLLEQREQGVLLCLCSRNNEADVREAFRARADFLLRWNHLAAWRVDWRPKSINLGELAAELGLGLDGFLFIDDDPRQCAEVKARHPEITVLQLPSEEGAIQQLLDHHWIFDRGAATAEARRRSDMYQENAQRELHRARFATVQEFVDSLQLVVDVVPLTADAAVRASELCHRVNQFHPSVSRRSPAEIVALLKDERAQGLIVSARDRFGDYGQVGVVLFSAHGDELRVETLALSCRALGRGVEHRVVAALGTIGQAQSLRWLSIRYQPSARNRPAYEFLDSLRAERRPDGEATWYRLPCEAAAALSFEATVSSAHRDAGDRPVATAPGSAGLAAELPFDRIVSQLSRADHILAALKGRPGQRLETVQAPAAALYTPTQSAIEATWRELLGVEAVGLEDDFFDVGGHSLAAVRIISRVRETFGVEVPLRLFFDGPLTIARLAEAVEELELQAAGEERVAALLQEMEEVSSGDIDEPVGSEGQG